MTIALLITAGVVVYSAVAGVVWYWNPGRLRGDYDGKEAFAIAWPITVSVLLLFRAIMFPARTADRLLTRRAERKRLPQAKVVRDE